MMDSGGGIVWAHPVFLLWLPPPLWWRADGDMHGRRKSVAGVCLRASRSRATYVNGCGGQSPLFCRGLRLCGAGEEMAGDWVKDGELFGFLEGVRE